MTHIRIEGLTAGNAQHHGTQNNEGNAWALPHEADRVMRTDRHQNVRVAGDIDDAQHRNHGKPDHHDRTEELSNTGGSSLLHYEQAQQNDQGEGNDVPMQRRGYDL